MPSSRSSKRTGQGRGNSHGSNRADGMSNNSVLGLDRNASLRAGLCDNVLALISVGGVHHGLSFGGAFLFTCALLLGNIIDDGLTLGNGGGGTLLLGNISNCGGALLHRPGRTFLLVPCHKVGGCFGAANRLICGGTSFSGHCLVRGMALGGVGAGRIMPSVTISRLGLGISQDGGKKT